MKTKYDAIVKVKKEFADRIERDIQKINSSISSLKEKIEQKKDELKHFSLPKSGSFAILSQIKLQQQLLREEIENLKLQIQTLKSRKNALINELKKARVEYEKMKYLQGEEIKKQLKKALREEAQNMDEIATILENFKDKR
ncbi:MAG: FliJ family protein [Epsilonproteobacteria bacterium]|nr:FliJ family protein [Campylobacterota bacterium]